MKKYRSEAREIATETNKEFERTHIIVWIGASEYWDYVYLCKTNHRLYIRNRHNFEALDTVNIRKIGAI